MDMIHKILIKRGYHKDNGTTYNKNGYNRYGLTALTNAAKNGNLDLIKEMIKNGG